MRGFASSPFEPRKQEQEKDWRYPVNEAGNRELRRMLNGLWDQYQPQRHPFFHALYHASSDVVVRDPEFLRQLYVIYQTGMHTLRQGTWYTPHLDSPGDRRIKLWLLGGNKDSDYHHHHRHSSHELLEDLFDSMGTKDLMYAEAFTSAKTMTRHFHPKTPLGKWVASTDRLCRMSTGTLVMAQTLCNDWRSALAHSFQPHFPKVKSHEYFALSSEAHKRTLQLTLALCEKVLLNEHENLGLVLQHAEALANNMDDLWQLMLLCLREREAKALYLN
jgi:hypothetical protein